MRPRTPDVPPYEIDYYVPYSTLLPPAELVLTGVRERMQEIQEIGPLRIRITPCPEGEGYLVHKDSGTLWAAMGLLLGVNTLVYDRGLGADRPASQVFALVPCRHWPWLDAAEAAIQQAQAE